MALGLDYRIALGVWDWESWSCIGMRHTKCTIDKRNRGNAQRTNEPTKRTKISEEETLLLLLLLAKYPCVAMGDEWYVL